MISIVIPVLNEGSTIRHVIKNIQKTQLPIEIIVVDDNSTDNTVSEAMRENVRVITSSQRGKGVSMREGMMAAKHDIIVYLDGDILTYPSNIVDLLANPIVQNQADFVKSYFERQAGRVTQLVAKPLLGILFPALSNFQQPLSGMIAARKSFLQGVHFENDYGVDIGLLIDMHLKGARIAEVNIGRVENAMQSWENLGKMSREVSRAILQKAENFPTQNLETLSNIHIIREQMEQSILESIDKLQKMVIFNLDEVILTQNYVYLAAMAFEKEESLMQILQHYTDPIDILTRSAALFEDRNLAELLEVADCIPLAPGAAEVITQLKARGYVVGIVTDGFECVANHIKNKLGIDFVFANRLHLYHSVATGEITIPSYFLKENVANKPASYDKSHLMYYIQEKYHTSQQNIIYVGNGESDKAMLSMAGIGVAYNPVSDDIAKVADRIIHGASLAPLLKIVPDTKAVPQQWLTPTRAKKIGWGSLALLAAGAVVYYNVKQSRKKKKAAMDC
ncbi:HAD superfamily phosphoserine phosphatase-like hydrolase [Chitinophaga skermanii]|uniref:HAD superfamily phosphoserine phosphatase-like hydrolase n=1 Tax=Chitinophaga skermanii TaxID=331697 RepID=A0A327QH97_9BACT|nr:HAD-IB family phosphatase [Chitinophaga skermanii]RAJ03986.1 HAD superfamily phosphoserine phosphatase-like hydrolase [Chitinophaga skermanii]